MVNSGMVVMVTTEAVNLFDRNKMKEASVVTKMIVSIVTALTL